MSCHLILGRRSDDRAAVFYERLFAALEREEGPVCLILPEQSTFRHELYMEEIRNGRSLWDLDITSFRRLAEREIRETPLDTLGRDLLIYDILAAHRDDFKALKPKEISVGYVEDISSVLKEASMNGFTADLMQEKAAEIAADETAGDLADKLLDVALIQNAMEERGFHDESGRLFVFASLIREKGLFSRARFFFNDFFDFTAAEYEVLGALMESGADFTFAFLCDRDDAVFQKTTKAVSRIVGLAQEKNVPLEITQLKGEISPTALGFAERNLLGNNGAVYNGEDDSIALFAAENKAAEVRHIARSVCDLLDRGYDRDDIGVGFRNISGYEHYIEDIFAAYGIPCYIDKAYSLLHHPVYRFGARLFRVAAEKWSFPAVFALLKSGLFPMDADDCDALENYCLAHGIKGHRFRQEEDWPYCDEREGEDVGRINELRRSVQADLMPFADAIQKEDTAAHYSAILWRFLEHCRCDRTMDTWQKDEEAKGRMKKGAELAAGLGALCDMLDQLVAAFPDRLFTLSEYIELLKMGAAAVTVRTIPPELDAVEISVLGQSRPGRKKVMFLGGVNEGVFPSGVSEGGFFNIADRSILKERTDCWLQDKSFFYESEDIVVYQAITMATERLVFSYTTFGSEGKAYPSPLITTLKKMFPYLEETFVRDDLGTDGCCYSVEEVLNALALSLREDEVEGWDDIKATLLDADDVAPRLRYILSSLDYTGRSKFLSAESLQNYPGRDLSLSVSSIELFRRCPFSYFAKYGLHLRERKILQFAAPDLGNIFHAILCDLLEEMKNDNKPWEEVGSITTEHIAAMVDQKLKEFAGENLFPAEHMVYISHVLTENLRFLIDMMALQTENGDQFVPALWEVPFGKDQTLPPYEIRVDEEGRKIRLNGVIDRVDVAQKDGQTFFRIVDYKSSGKELAMDDLYYGVSPQLPVYSIVLEQGKEDVIPAGMFYQSMKDVVVRDQKNISDQKIKDKLNEEMALKGYIIGDKSFYGQSKNAKTITAQDYDTIRSHTEKKIGDIGRDIFGGRTEIRPYLRSKGKSCDYCPYEALCGYEPELMGKEDRLVDLNDSEAKAKMYEEDKKA
ncbi:MAG: PD-(D/E)XK nuclease family protein [Firmicutes bacterium]|nr:PD-(D/E)XK nuclease family protein [Bacillota bacterium]